MTEHRPTARIAADLGGVLRFFTRLPVPPLSRADDPAAMPRFAEAGWALPVAGALLALPGALLAAALSATDLPALAAGALVVALSALVTGGMAEDGLADTADGLAGGRDRERRLAIMRDSRIGVFGAAALALALIARASLAGALVGLGPLAAAGALVASGAVGRGALLAVWAGLEPARADGMSAAAGRPGGRAATAGLLIAAALALPAGGAGGPAGVAVGLLLAALAAAALGLAARRAIGGQTGDVLGAAGHLGEIAFLVGLLA